jgi:ribose transport system permease protein
MSLSVVVIGWLQQHHMNAVVSVFVTLGLGMLIGIANSVFVVALRVPALITTLGMSSILAAAAVWLTNGAGVSLGISHQFAKAGSFTFFSIPAPVIYMMIVAGFFYYLMELTPAGRKYRAVGSNRDAAKLSGLRVDALTVQVLLLSSVTASLAGIVYVARLGTAPIAAGDPYLLASFAAVFLGSTQVLVGRFNVLGTLVAVYLLATGVNGVLLMFPNNEWIPSMFTGVTLILAVALSIRRRAVKVRRTSGGHGNDVEWAHSQAEIAATKDPVRVQEIARDMIGGS